jgi:hypothetical protein
MDYEDLSLSDLERFFQETALDTTKAFKPTNLGRNEEETAMRRFKSVLDIYRVVCETQGADYTQRRLPSTIGQTSRVDIVLIQTHIIEISNCKRIRGRSHPWS